MVGESDAVHIEGLTLEPVGGRIKIDHGVNRRFLVRLQFYPDAAIFRQRQQMIDDIEALLALRPIDAANVDQDGKIAFGIVAQEFEYPHDLAGFDIENELVERNARAAYSAGKRRGKFLAEFDETLRHLLPQRS